MLPDLSQIGPCQYFLSLFRQFINWKYYQNTNIVSQIEEFACVEC